MTDDKEQSQALSTSVGLSLGRRSKYSPLFESESSSEVDAACRVLDEVQIDYRRDRCDAKGALPSTPKLFRVNVPKKRKKDAFLALEKIHGRSVVARDLRSPKLTMFSAMVGPYGALGLVGFIVSLFVSSEKGAIIFAIFGNVLLLAFMYFFAVVTPQKCSKNTCQAKLKRRDKVCPQCGSKIGEVRETSRG